MKRSLKARIAALLVSTAVPLVLACVLETGLIASFHSGPGQILWMVVATMALLGAVLGAMYLAERLGIYAAVKPRTAAQVDEGSVVNKS